MALRIEDYAIIGDTETVALVGTTGAIDWLCLPRFDAAACFAALLGDETNGRWMIAPTNTPTRTTRRYRPGTLVLETTFETPDGAVRVVDGMPPREGRPDVIRLVEGISGMVSMRLELTPRFDYGQRLPLLNLVPGGAIAVAGPDALALHSSVELTVTDGAIVAEFVVSEGDQVGFDLSWFPSHEQEPESVEAAPALARTEAWWREWSGRCTYQGRHQEVVLRSLMTLKALTYAPTGSIVAAATTSLPEEIGGVRNWDYRYCWLRDGAFTIAALARFGYTEEAVAMGAWLRRAVAGDPDQVQIMYGIGGEARLSEFELPWLSGYEDSRPVRVGNAASDQFQLDIYGEVIAGVYHAAVAGVRPAEHAANAPGLNLEAIVDTIERRWREPDDGIWEVRSGRQHFTYSKFSAWYAVDRAIKLAEIAGQTFPEERWHNLRDEIHADICQNGFDTNRQSFVQSYGATALDASLLLIPGSGFLPDDDPRIVGTVDAVQRELAAGPFVSRYSTSGSDDGLAGSEGAFLICSFWLVNALAHVGRRTEAQANLDALLALQNEVGLVSEEYDPVAKRFLGNFPQAFSHIGLLSSILVLDEGFTMR
ncbi:MAG TPA: glycoside hydrolase family 15 protein [Thermomicrobiales bacterium]|nr:glycoside hydrolase family 15 protein [Thermomicrobiales bacterium]